MFKRKHSSLVFKKYIEAIGNHLRGRFPHVELLDAFSIFDPQNLPSDEDELTTYGQDKVKVFSTTYGEGPDPVVDTHACFMRKFSA